ncbi:MAG: C25 family cysteine peptidase [candidate division WOR-3 bacterium]
MKRFLVLAALCSASTAGPGSQVLKVEERANGVDLVLELEDFRVARAATEVGQFAVLEMPGAGATGEFGHPMTPVYRQLVEVPFGAELTVTTEKTAVEEMRLDFPLFPRQPPIPKSGPAPAFEFDAKAYAAEDYGPEIGASIVEVPEVRGHRLALVEIVPAQYLPANNLLRLVRGLKVTLHWTGGDYALTSALRRRYDSPVFADRLKGVVANPEQLGPDAPPALPVGCLIIVPDVWEANIRPLAEWRRRKGYHVFVRTLTQVGGGQANTVKAYIQDAYDNWPIPPSMVMLVGDVDRIGYFTGQGEGSPPTDLNFGLVAGSDYLPDIDVSRASVTSIEQLDSLVARTVRYEQNLWDSGTGWLKKAYFVASSDGGNHQVAERTHQYCMGKLRLQDVLCDSLWLYYGSGTPITTAVNSGRSWVTYSGHGSENSWADPNFTNGDVHQLTNDDLVPFVQTYACLSGNFASSSYPECFSEAWIRSGLRGAICHVASTVTSYWTEDDTLERRVFDFMFDSTYCWVAGGFNKAKLKYYQQMGTNPTTRRYLEMYNYIGDGAIDVYWQEPATINVAHPPVIPLGTYLMQVAVTADGRPVRDALVGLAGKNDSSVFATGYTDTTGTVILQITTAAPESISVTVTGHNLAPYLGTTQALPSSGAYVMLLRYSVNDSAGGNNDGIVNPGETIVLPVWLKNWGSATAQNVRAWLRSTDPAVTLLDTLKNFGNIAAGDSAFTGAAGFRFAVAQSCTNGYVLRLSLAVRDAADSVWVSLLALSVGGPVLHYAACRAEDAPPGGNGNGMLDPGESAELVVTLRNSGLGHAYDVTAVLRSGDTRLTVLDSVGEFGAIRRDTTGENEADRFRVAADSAIPRETQIPCTLRISTGAVTQVRTFNLSVGVVRSFDPIPDGPRQPALYYAYDDADSAYTEAPDFNWVEIRGLGTRLTLSDDQVYMLGVWWVKRM